MSESVRLGLRARLLLDGDNLSLLYEAFEHVEPLFQPLVLGGRLLRVQPCRCDVVD